MKFDLWKKKHHWKGKKIMVSNNVLHTDVRIQLFTHWIFFVINLSQAVTHERRKQQHSSVLPLRFLVHTLNTVGCVIASASHESQ